MEQTQQQQSTLSYEYSDRKKYFLNEITEKVIERNDKERVTIIEKRTVEEEVFLERKTTSPSGQVAIASTSSYFESKCAFSSEVYNQDSQEFCNMEISSLESADSGMDIDSPTNVQEANSFPVPDDHPPQPPQGVLKDGNKKKKIHRKGKKTKKIKKKKSAKKENFK